MAGGLGIEDPDAYWPKVATNLDAERFRLVFVSDQIPPSLRRIVEFLNEHMNIDVLGIEVSQYTDSTRTQQIIVPRFVGETEAARQTRRSRAGAGAGPHRPRRAALIVRCQQRCQSGCGRSTRLGDGTAESRVELDGRRRHRRASLSAFADCCAFGRAGDGPPGTSRCGSKLEELRQQYMGWRTPCSAHSAARGKHGPPLRGRPEVPHSGPKPRSRPLADPDKRQSFLEIIEEVVRSLNPPA